MSGRLGRSLGLDLLGARICSMDCIYCEVGATQNLTMERKPYVPAEDILFELEQWKDEGHEPPEIITLGGLGEPCLNSEMKYVIEGVHNLFPGIPVGVLTNSTPLLSEEVRRDLALADVVLPSLDSLVLEEFLTLNRPFAGIGPKEVAQGLLDFRSTFDGKIFLEILLAKGVNDTDANLDELEAFCKQLRPDRVDVVTLSRPGTVKKTGPVEKETLERWRKVLHAATPGERKHKTAEAGTSDPEKAREMIRASLERRPQTVSQLSVALGIAPETTGQVIETMLAGKELVSRGEGGNTYYHSSRHIIEE